VITVLSGKGGCGKTTIATNLALVLADAGASRVCLVDLDLALGDVANLLGLPPGGSLLTAVGADGRLDPGRVPDLLTHYAEGLTVCWHRSGRASRKRFPRRRSTT
jgi:pilus assembly protein CpaE